MHMPPRTIRPLAGRSVPSCETLRASYAAAVCVRHGRHQSCRCRWPVFTSERWPRSPWRSRSSTSSRRTPTSSSRALIGWQVVELGLVLVLVPPLLALGIEALVGLASRPLRAVVHLLFVALFVALFAIQALKHIAPDGASAILILIASNAGVFAAIAYARANGLRSFVTVLSPAPAVVLAVFLFFSPVSDLTFASGSAETADVSSHGASGTERSPSRLAVGAAGVVAEGVPQPSIRVR
jgi:hypothetical protein